MSLSGLPSLAAWELGNTGIKLLFCGLWYRETQATVSFLCSWGLLPAHLCLSTFESSPLVIPCALTSFLELMVIHSQEEQRKYVYTIFSRLESLGDYFHCNCVNKKIRIFMILNLPFQTCGSLFVQLIIPSSLSHVEEGG